MMLSEKNAQSGEQSSSSETKHSPTSLISRGGLLRRLKRSREARSKFVESHLDKSIAYQIRSLRDNEKWTQGVFAEKLGIKHQNNVSARLENPNYGKHSLTTLKKIASTCDVALVVWFIPFSRMLDWVTGTPYLDYGLSESFYSIPSFTAEEHKDVFETPTQTIVPEIIPAPTTLIESYYQNALAPSPTHRAIDQNIKYFWQLEPNEWWKELFNEAQKPESELDLFFGTTPRANAQIDPFSGKVPSQPAQLQIDRRLYA